MALDKTLELCLALRDAGYNPEAKADPEAWNAKLDALPEEEKIKGYYWRQNPTEGWYPDLGRRAYVEEIAKIIGEDGFETKYGVSAQKPDVHQSKTHEEWCQELIDALNASK